MSSPTDPLTHFSKTNLSNVELYFALHKWKQPDGPFQKYLDRNLVYSGVVGLVSHFLSIPLLGCQLRCLGMSNLCAGVQMCGCVGVQVCGCAGVQVCGCAGVRVCGCATITQDTDVQGGPFQKCLNRLYEWTIPKVSRPLVWVDHSKGV